MGQEAASQQIILARQSENPATAAAVTALTNVRGTLGRLAQMTPVPQQAATYRAKLAELQAEEHRLVHEIGGQLAALDRDEPWIEIDEIRENIPPGSVLVDIARFDTFDFAARGKETTWRPARYAAWITPAGAGDVTIVDLGDAAEIDTLVADYRKALGARLVDLDAAGPLVAGAAASLRLGREATAAGVEREAVRPKVLVLATHGFFLPDQQVKHDERHMLAGTRGIAGTRPLDDATGKPVEDPLLRCGLLFTGANLPAAERGGDDGVLTGAEIVGLDLLGTDLVVLSACDTGVGRVDVGEGVAGLRQAFQIAGARSVVATLWQVPDEESTAIMTGFYANLATGQPASQALRTAQLDFLEARRTRGGPAACHPYFWAAYGITGR